LEWAACQDPFPPDARSRPLAPRTIRLRREHVLTAVTALIKAGASIERPTSLAALVAPAAFKAIMRHLLARPIRSESNASEHGVARTLVAIAKEWVRPEPSDLIELKRALSRVPAVKTGLRPKNTALLARFEDPDVLSGSSRCPHSSWARPSEKLSRIAR
jgi:hypothetical protein